MDGSVEEPGWLEIDRLARCCEAVSGHATACVTFESWIRDSALPQDEGQLTLALVVEHNRWARMGARPDEMTMSYLRSLFAALARVQNPATTRESE
jgi:hypothetical protein